MKNWLKNEYIVVTGASGGIGREMTKLLVEKYGAKVIGIGRSEDKMRSLQTELKENAKNFRYHIFDVGERRNWMHFKDWLVAENIYPKLLINNAGIFPTFKRIMDCPSTTFERVIQVNYLSIVYAIDTLSPILKGAEKDKPAVINVSSSAALCTVVGTAAYSASKAAIKGYTEALQMEERGKKYIGLIYPGTTKSELFREDKNTQNSVLDKIAMPTQKMAKKIVRAILRKKKRAVLGWDAKLMNIIAKIVPVKGLFFIYKVMKISRSKVFKEVF